MAQFLYDDKVIADSRTILDLEDIEYSDIRYVAQELGSTPRYRIMYTDKEGNYKSFRKDGRFSLT